MALDRSCSRVVIRAAAVAGLFLLAVDLRGQPAPYDLLIRNARIADGTGSPWYRADLAVRGDRVAGIAFQIEGPALRTIDVKGQVLAPGFIDIHSHARAGIFDVPTAENYLRQGVTTLIEGPDGSSPIPLKPFLERVAAAHVTVNFGTFIGQGSVRESIAG